MSATPCEKGKPCCMRSSNAPLAPMGPVFLADRFPPLHHELVTMLRSLHAADWGRPTACALWAVKDIAAHLLDTNLRRLSFGRDRLDQAPDRAIANYADLVSYLNRLNAEWVVAARRISPRLLTELLDHIGPEVHALFDSLDPYAPALFSVLWAGETTSPNWFDVAREYTEQWLHQQQIREAVGARDLTDREWLGPALDVFVRALPFTYREVEAEEGSSVEIHIDGDAGGAWTLIRGAGGWKLFTGSSKDPAAKVSLDQDAAWRLFSKNLPQSARAKIRIEGKRSLGQPLLGSVAVMA
jgi:uncharacterized protein (TIGR03083 family)